MIATQRWLRMSGANSQSSQATRGVLDLRHYNAEYVEWGEGPPLVLVPGLAGGIDLIEPLARELAQHFHVISYQTRGESDCFALRRRFDLNDLAADLAEFVFLRGLERPAILGVSFGGVIALASAARYPRLYSSVSAQGIGLRFETGMLQRIAGMVLSSYPLPKDSPFVNQFFNLLFGHKATAERLHRVTETCWQTDQSVMAHRLRLLRRLNLGELAARVRIPSMLLAGTRDFVVSCENTSALAAELADCQQVILNRAGHLAPITHTAETTSAIQRFYESSAR
jgi:pimeloyl-ACP methyl ester carboxylesterase